MTTAELMEDGSKTLEAITFGYWLVADDVVCERCGGWAVVCER